MNGSEISHEVFIYGYDDEKQAFMYADLMNNKSNKYTFSECDYSEMEAAFNSAQNLFIPIVKSFAAIQYVESAPFAFSFDYVRESVNEYVHPDKIKTRLYNDYAASFLTGDPEGPLYWIPKVYMGTDVYDYFSDYIDYEFKHSDSPILDRRLFHAMYDHKEMMLLRLKYLLDNNHLSADKVGLIEEYNKIRDNALLTRNLVLKYNMVNRKSTIEKIKELSRDSKNHEIKLLSEIFDL
jgi:hypothetical protein